MRWSVMVVAAMLFGLALWLPAVAQTAGGNGAAAPAGGGETSGSVLALERQHQTEAAVDRALAWLATQQQADGSFKAPDGGQPAITALCTLAFFSRGHRLDQGPYGELIRKGVEFTLSCQETSGLICKEIPGPVYPGHPFIPRVTAPEHNGLYNNAISGLMLTEAYGQSDRETAARIRQAVNRALDATVHFQNLPKRHQCDEGGWRYVREWGDADADISVTSWQLMFLRSARNNGFEVPSATVAQGLAYVKRCFDDRKGTFSYSLLEHYGTFRSTAGMGILSLSLAGEHDSEMAKRAGEYILSGDFRQYNNSTVNGRYHYALFYCTQATFQLGGRYWREFYPPVVQTLLDNQARNGSWQPESSSLETVFGNAFTTSLMVLALTTPDQLLPIFQR
jgi:hypothetical protein